MQKHLLLLCCFIAITALFASCFDDCRPPFPPSSQIDKFRVLAIKAEPPEIAPNQNVTMSFLAVDQNGLVRSDVFPGFPQCLADGKIANPSAFWIACLPDTKATQPDSFCANPSIFASLSPPDGGSPTDGGNGGISIPDELFDPSKFQLFLPPCGANASWRPPSDMLEDLPPESQTKGFEVLAVLSVVFAQQQQISLKRLRVSNRPTEQRNTNPRILGIIVDGRQASTCRPEKPEGCELLRIPLRSQIPLRAQLDIGRRDWLEAKANTSPQREDITVEWFSTHGEFDLRRTVYSGQIPPQHSPWPMWLPQDYLGQQLPLDTEVQIIAIARDNRGGVDWLSTRIALTAEQTSTKNPD